MENLNPWLVIKRISLSSPAKPTPAPTPTVRMPTGPPIEGPHSPAMGLGRGRGRAHISPPLGSISRPGQACPELASSQATQPFHRMPGQYRIFSEGIRLPTRGPPMLPPGYVGLGRGFNPSKCWIQLSSCDLRVLLLHRELLSDSFWKLVGFGCCNWQPTVCPTTMRDFQRVSVRVILFSPLAFECSHPVVYGWYVVTVALVDNVHVVGC